MTYYSDKPVSVYMADMKSQLSNFTDFGVERFTGIIIGKFFSVTHHCGHEMNRRVTNEKHRAIGIASKHDDGTKITCIRLAGMTNPLSMIGIFLFYVVLLLLMGGSDLAFSLPALIVGMVTTLFIALTTAISHSVTERGQEGSRTLTAFLIDPANYYSIF